MKKLYNVLTYMQEKSMSVLQGVLLEEIQRLEKNIESYEIMLSQLPRGTIFIKSIGSSAFAYRKRKEGKKVISEYLGNIESNKAYEEIEASKEYKRIKQNLSVAKKELVKIKRAYKAYD